MAKEQLVRVVISISIFFAVASISAWQRPTFGQSCSTPNDGQIVSEIYDRIKADKGLATQISHINVISVNGAVKFQGWADTKRDYDKIQYIGLNANCAKLVNMNSFLDEPPPADSQGRSSVGCASGTKPCGDICIPEGDSCNLSGNTKP